MLSIDVNDSDYTYFPVCVGLTYAHILYIDLYNNTFHMYNIYILHKYKLYYTKYIQLYDKIGHLHNFKYR